MLTPTLPVLVGFLITFHCGVQGFQWDSFPEDGAVLYSCSGRKVSMPWKFIQGEEELYDIRWTFDGLFTTQLIGSFTYDQLLPSPQYSKRVRHQDNGGLSLSDVTVDDTGNYTVEVNVKNELGVVVSHRRQVFLQVADDVMLHHQHLQANQEPVALWNNELGQWVIGLTCGTFTFAGQPPTDVTWTTPAGDTKPSTGYHDGNFLLTLTSPVRGGNYSCHVPKHLVSDICGKDTQQVEASVHVDEVIARLSLIEAEQTTLKEENKKLNEKLNEKLEEELQNMTEIHKQDVAALKQYVKEEKGEVVQDIQRVENIHTADNISLMNSIERLEKLTLKRDCLGVKLFNKNSAVRTISVKPGIDIDVYCDQSTDGGGWTVIQKRQDGSVNFNRNWAEYETGFGNISGEHWIGLANLHRLTSSNLYSLRIDLEDFDGTTAYAVYNRFSVNGPDDQYRLSVSGYSGTAGDSIIRDGGGSANNQKFSTPDNDNDNNGNSCASSFNSGWWFNKCMHSNLNGVYKKGGGQHRRQGITWYYWHTDSRSYKRAEMKIRPQ